MSRQVYRFDFKHRLDWSEACRWLNPMACNDIAPIQEITEGQY